MHLLFSKTDQFEPPSKKSPNFKPSSKIKNSLNFFTDLVARKKDGKQICYVAALFLLSPTS